MDAERDFRGRDWRFHGKARKGRSDNGHLSYRKEKCIIKETAARRPALKRQTREANADWVGQ